MKDLSWKTVQSEFCRSRDFSFVGTSPESMCGFAPKTVGLLPANALRHPPEGTNSGWYVWFGEQWSTANDFFKPVCVSHIFDQYPSLTRLFGLPAGYRFLVAGELLDVWYDDSLLSI